jgi:hypothetical protein
VVAVARLEAAEQLPLHRAELAGPVGRQMPSFSSRIAIHR